MKGLFKTNHAVTAGFTMLELLISFAILILLASIIISGFTKYQRHQQYLLFRADIQNALSEAKAKTVGSVNDTTYGMYVGTSSVQFFSGTVPVVGSASNTIIPFPTGMYATSTLSNGRWYFNFNRITGVGSATGVITIVDSKGGESNTLTITSTGLIR